MSHLDIHLLGEFLILADDEPVTDLHQARLQSLLAYLLLHCQTPQTRQHISFVFWPDSTETQARTNLRKALYHIRQELPDADRFIQSDTNTMQWLPGAPFTLDVADFKRMVGQADAAREREEPAEVVAHLAEAAARYQGELLPGCYDEWLLTEREQLHQTALAVLERLMQRLEEAHDYAAAIRQGQHLLTLDPLHEATYRRLMRLHALNGDRAGALRVYHTCADLLQRELDVAPNADTQAVYARLLRADASATSDAQPPQRSSTTRLVGRKKEWRQLQAAWRMATQMQPHFALVAGEAGIGKTHLVEELRRWAAQQGITTAHARAYAAESGLAYGPVIEWLRSEPIQAQLDRLDRVWLTEVARLLPELLEVHPDLPRPEPLTERWQRQRLFEALRRAILLAKAPLLLVLDDLQWCDGETLEWLHFLLRARQDQAGQAQTPARLLVAGTARPEEVDPQHPLTRLQLDLQRSGQMTKIELKPLTADETGELAMQVSERTLNSEETQWLYQASEGNPLFVVEMVRAGDWQPHAHTRWGSADFEAPISEIPDLPPKVYAVIESRLAHLSPSARELAGLAATIGRSFTFDLLAQAGELDEDALVQGLDELWQRRIVHEHSAHAYDFSHDRIRDVAYAEISPVRRRYYHRRMVQALISLHANELDAISGQLGFHCERGQQPKETVKYYRRAVNSSVELYAFDSAVYYLQRILTLLEEFPTSVERVRQQIECWLEKANLLIISKGWTDAERKQALEQAYQLAKEANDDALLYKAMSGLRGYYGNTGDQYMADGLAQEMFLLAERSQDQKLLCEANCSMATAHLQRGECQSSLQYFRAALDMAEGIGPEFWQIRARSRMVEALWMCGYVEEAQRMASENIRTLDKQEDPFGRVHEREFAMWVYQRMGNLTAMRQLAAEIVELCDRFGFPNYALSSQVIVGWGMVQTGAVEEGMRQISQSIDAREQIGDRVCRPYFLSLLAEAQAQSGRVVDALNTLAQAQEFSEESGDHMWDAELLRLTGDFQLRLGPADTEAEVCYQSALDIARQQGARSLELRAATSLARLWRSRGKQAEAYNLLAPVYGWFSEGFDTSDFQIAQELLDELHAEISS